MAGPERNQGTSVVMPKEFLVHCSSSAHGLFSYIGTNVGHFDQVYEGSVKWDTCSNNIQNKLGRGAAQWVKIKSLLPVLLQSSLSGALSYATVGDSLPRQLTVLTVLFPAQSCLSLSISHHVHVYLTTLFSVQTNN